MYVLLGTVFVASLLGSLHCVGMCGPFALIAASHSNQRPIHRPATVLAFAYSFGRLVSYSLVGAIFGSIGQAMNNSLPLSTISHWQQTATYVAGATMIVVGLIAFARYLGWRIAMPQSFAIVQKLLQFAFSKTNQLPPATRAFSVGALASLMPCGWLYTFAITAAGTGSPILGALLMATFWAGTVPIMTALMLGFNKIGRSVQPYIPVTMAVIVIAVGVFTIAYRAPVVIADSPSQIVVGEPGDLDNRVQSLTQQVSQIDHEQLPCCCQESK